MSGNKIRAELALRGMTITELCNVTGISKASMYRKMSGLCFFDTDEISKICTALNIKDARKMHEIFFA